MYGISLTAMTPARLTRATNSPGPVLAPIKAGMHISYIEMNLNIELSVNQNFLSRFLGDYDGNRKGTDMKKVVTMQPMGAVLFSSMQSFG